MGQTDLHPVEEVPPSNEQVALDFEVERLRKQITSAIRMGCIDQGKLTRRFSNPENPFLNKQFVHSIVVAVLQEMRKEMNSHNIYAEACEFISANREMIDLLTNDTIKINENGELELNKKLPSKEIASRLKTIHELWGTRFDFLAMMGIHIDPAIATILQSAAVTNTPIKELPSQKTTDEEYVELAEFEEDDNAHVYEIDDSD
jgi:hypothetical protein